jgi:hypothetical protein
MVFLLNKVRKTSVDEQLHFLFSRRLLLAVGWREACTEALDLVCLLNNSVKAKAAEASLVRTLIST